MNCCKTPFFTIVFIFLGLFLYTRFLGTIPLSINSVQTTKTNLFQVEGMGKATAIPNTVLISLGVSKTGQSISDVQSQINKTANSLNSDLKSLGVEEKNIKTTNYSISPNYDYQSGRQNITGYTATQNLEVKIKPIDLANKVIDKATSDGANLVGGVTFMLDDQTQKEMENKARQEAVKNAKEKAESLSNASGIRLGRIIDVSENFNPLIPLRAVPMTAEKVADQTSLTPGENTVTVTVTLSYETL